MAIQLNIYPHNLDPHQFNFNADLNPTFPFDEKEENVDFADKIAKVLKDRWSEVVF